MKRKILDKKFYYRKADKVAPELLGKILLKKEKDIFIGGRIVETEAYLGSDDPASISYQKKKRKLSQKLYGEPGEIFIYMVHGNWLLNILVDKENIPAAILIRAIEPLYGLHIIKERRNVKRERDLTNGPGKFTKALNIDDQYNGYNVSDPSSPIIIVDDSKILNEKIARSKRIGVSEDLDIPLRFYIIGNIWVSKINVKV